MHSRGLGRCLPWRKGPASKGGLSRGLAKKSMSQLFSDPGKKGTPFWGRPFLVGQPPKKRGKNATEQLRCWLLSNEMVPERKSRNSGREHFRSLRDPSDKPSLVVSFKGTPGFIPSFPAEHQQTVQPLKKKQRAAGCRRRVCASCASLLAPHHALAAHRRDELSTASRARWVNRNSTVCPHLQAIQNKRCPQQKYRLEQSPIPMERGSTRMVIQVSLGPV